MKEEIKKEMPIPNSFPHIKNERHEETTNEEMIRRLECHHVHCYEEFMNNTSQHDFAVK